MWQGASAQKIAATRGYGATVDLEATGPGGGLRAPRRARSRRRGARSSHPFDDPLVIAGAGHRRPRDRGGRTRLRRGDRRRSVAAVSSAASSRARRPHRVIAVEPELSAGAARRDRRRRADARRGRRSIADGLNAPFAGGSRSRSAATSSACSSPRRRSSTRSASSTSAPSSRASRPARRRPRPGSRARSRPNTRCSWSRAATSPRKPPLLSWPGDEGRDPPRVRPLDRALRLREHVHDAFHEARAARRDLLALPPVLHRQAEAGRHGRTRRALPEAGSKRPSAQRARPSSP